MYSVESIVIIVNPSLVGSGLPSSSDFIFMETSDVIPDLGNYALLEVAGTTSPNTSQQIGMFPLLFSNFICILFYTSLRRYLLYLF